MHNEKCWARTSCASTGSAANGRKARPPPHREDEPRNMRVPAPERRESTFVGLRLRDELTATEDFSANTKHTRCSFPRERPMQATESASWEEGDADCSRNHRHLPYLGADSAAAMSVRASRTKTQAASPQRYQLVLQSNRWPRRRGCHRGRTCEGGNPARRLDGCQASNPDRTIALQRSAPCSVSSTHTRVVRSSCSCS